MTISPDHFLEGAQRDIIAGGSPMDVRRVLIIHFTSGMSGASSIESWRNEHAGKVCAHLVIDRDGVITQCRAFDRQAGHAGVSRWQDPHTGILYNGVNAFGIGIELANAGDSVEGTADNAKAFGRYPCPAIMARHKSGGPMTLWETFPQAQLDSCLAAAKALVEKYHLDDVCGHEDIAPERKNDPGPAFPMLAFRESLGFSGPPHINRV